MSRRRRTSIEENEKLIGNLRGPHGFRLCRECKKEVQPPRKTFCSDMCVHFWRIKSDIKYLRRFIYERDRGICAICGIDTRYVKIEIEDAAHASMMESGVWSFEDHPIFLACLKKYNITVKESRKSLWECDHIKEVAIGGGECGIENLQSLCQSCHKKKSTQFRKEKNQIRRAKSPIVAETIEKL
jgi:5-methylcytosine-specific restriction protein A